MVSRELVAARAKRGRPSILRLGVPIRAKQDGMQNIHIDSRHVHWRVCHFAPS